MNIAAKGALVASVPLAVACVLGLLLNFLVDESERETVEKTQRTELVIFGSSLLHDLIEAQTTLEDSCIKKSPKIRQALSASAQKVSNDMVKLDKLESAMNMKSSESERLHTLCAEAIQILQQASTHLQDASQQDNRVLCGEMHQSVLSVADTVDSRSHLVQDQNLQVHAASTSLVGFLRFGMIISCFAAIGIEYYFCRDISSRLKALAANANNLSRDRPLSSTASGFDEVAELDAAMREMAQSFDELRQKERALAENVTEIICMVDFSGAVTKMNHASLQVLGYQSEELVGKRYLDLIAEDDREDVVQKLRKMRQLKQRFNLENRTLHKSGALVSMVWSGHWSESERSFYFVAHDITSRKRQEELLKQSEAKVRAILEGMPIGVMMIDNFDKISFVNPSIEKLFNLSASELIGSSALSHFSKYPEMAVGETFCDLVSRASGPEHDWRAERRDSSDFQAELTAQVPSSRSEIGTVVAILDVTAAHELQQMRRDFVSIVSHELRSPLTSIKGFLSLLIEGVYGDVSVKLIDRAKRADFNTGRLVRLVNELLLIEKMDSGVMAVDKTSVFFSIIVQQAVESLKELAESNGVKVEFENIEVELLADPDRLTQVLINLISNAIKYSESGQTVSIQRVDCQDWLEVRIIDQGRGIPAFAQARIFERFQQVETDDSKRKGGTGLGLAICKSIIEQHGGSIGVDSEPGKGSSFWFRLPLTVVQKGPLES
jgi:PAS domain S-box-containing protein